MLFKERFGAGIVDGSITLTFRAWSRPQTRAGSRQRFGAYDGTRDAAGFLEIDAVDLVTVESITNAQARRAGFASASALVEELRQRSRRRPAGSSEVYRVAFRFVRAADERATLAANARLTSDEVATLRTRLTRMDARSERPWTLDVMRLIKRHPGVVSTRLAGDVGMPRGEFKMKVRKLKALGLTESLDVGYRVSPRGHALLRRLRSGGA
jgi:hypothetical protein